MPHYMLVIRENPAVFKDYSPERFQMLLEKFGAWSQKMAAEGRLVGGNKLAERGGSVLRKDGAKLQVKDGPFVETKEVLGGYFIIDARDYAHAVQACEDHPAFLYGASIEVREVDYMGKDQGESCTPGSVSKSS